jgi:hypothetical protein
VNTAQLYVEPIIVGSLVLALLSLPYAPEVMALVPTKPLKLPQGFALGAVLVGIAYLVGMLADRLIDSGLEAVEQHNRVRFACSKLKVDEKKPASDEQARIDAWIGKSLYKDLYPEDRRRWWVYSSADRIVDFLDYVRTRMRLLRALAFLLPGLFYAAAIGAARMKWERDCIVPCGPPSKQCAEAGIGGWYFLWTAPAPKPDDWHSLWVAPAVYALVALTTVILKDRDPIRRNVDRHKRGTVWWRAGSWHPPRTDRHSKMLDYASQRGWPADDEAWRQLPGDILAQPFVWLALLLHWISIPSWAWLINNWAVGAVIALLGALLSLAAGWSWWRTTGTFMVYVDGAGRFLQQKAGP